MLVNVSDNIPATLLNLWHELIIKKCIRKTDILRFKCIVIRDAHHTIVFVTVFDTLGLTVFFIKDMPLN